jgi:SOUL heme-binding protein
MKLRQILIPTIILVAVAIPLVSHATEEPPFKSLKKNGNFELREYANIPIASAPMEGMGKRDKSFNNLFQYISGENEGNQKIPMTAPVLVEGGATDAFGTEKGRMSFVIPSAISKTGAPKPTGEGMTTGKIEASHIATLRFKGWTSEDNRKKAEQELAALVKTYKLKPIGKPYFAFFDPPWTLEMFRRNEVWQRVKK